MKKNSGAVVWLLGCFLIAIDRLTKYWALLYCMQPYSIYSFISCELIINRGVSWGMFHTAHTFLFGMLTFCIALVTMMVWCHAISFNKKGLPIIGHVCVIAGSISNTIDRIWYGGVIDFIVLSYGSYSWPVFNVADIAIVCGVCLILFYDNKLR